MAATSEAPSAGTARRARAGTERLCLCREPAGSSGPSAGTGLCPSAGDRRSPLRLPRGPGRAPPNPRSARNRVPAKCPISQRQLLLWGTAGGGLLGAAATRTSPGPPWRGQAAVEPGRSRAEAGQEPGRSRAASPPASPPRRGERSARPPGSLGPGSGGGCRTARGL